MEFANFNHLTGDVLYKTIVQSWVGAYSSSTASSTDFWSSPSQTDNAISVNAKYDPTKFTVNVIYPHIAPAMPFNGTSDDLSYPLTGGSNKMRAFAEVTYGNDSRYFAKVYCFPGVGNTNLFDKPLVVGDAFDPFNRRDAWQIYGQIQPNGTAGYPEYQNLLATTGSSPRAKGYDVLFIDFSQGGGDMTINAGLELKFMEWLQTQTSSRFILGGPSMSGIVARLALLYSMPDNNWANGPGVRGRDLATKVKGYISIDSPQKGASISAALQRHVYFLGTDYSDAKSSWDQLSVPAAHEMLYNHYFSPIDKSLSDSHDHFYDNFLKPLGNYRKDIPSVAIAYSNFYMPNPTINRDYNQYCGDINILSNFEMKAGGPIGNSERYELMPGSTTDTYFGLFSYKFNSWIYPGYSSSHFSYFFHYSSDMLNPNWDAEVYKGTFIPIVSALDLSNFDDVNPPTLDEKAMAAYSPFDKVLYMKQPYNSYHSEFNKGSSTGITANDKRYQHIVFGQQLMASLSDALDYVETHSKKNIVSTILAPLLLQ